MVATANAPGVDVQEEPLLRVISIKLTLPKHPEVCRWKGLQAWLVLYHSPLPKPPLQSKHLLGKNTFNFLGLVGRWVVDFLLQGFWQWVSWGGWGKDTVLATVFSLPWKLPQKTKGYHNYLGELPSKAWVYWWILFGNLLQPSRFFSVSLKPRKMEASLKPCC